MKYCFYLVLLLTHGLSFASELKTCQTASFSAESSSGSGRLGEMVHRGNVVYCDPEVAFTADKLTVRRTENQQSMFEGLGNPIQMQQRNESFSIVAQAQTFTYQSIEQLFYFQDKVKINLASRDSQLSIKSSNVSYQFQNTNQPLPDALNASGDPVTILITGENRSPLEATASQLSYQHQSGILTLEGNVTFNQAGNRITAEKLIYNSIDQTWQVPPIKNKRIEIIKNSEL